MRSEKLLLNVLPASIAVRLKRGEEPIADHHDEISVLFADLAEFTVRSAQESPAQTVAVLNEVFSAFDELVHLYGLETIRTIGDPYMVAARGRAPPAAPRRGHPAHALPAPARGARRTAA